MMLLQHFRSHYPQGSLTSELLQYEQGQYVVRVTVQVEGRVLGSGLAAAPTVEAAEDRARDRALAVLVLETPSVQPTAHSNGGQKTPQPQPVATGAVQPSPPSPSPQVPPSPNPPLPKSPPPQVPPSTPPQTVAEPPEIEPTPPPEPVEPPISPTVEEPALQAENPPIEEPEPEPPEEPEPSPPAETTAKPDPVPPSEPIDFSEVIAKTNIEMKRLGWSNEQGRNYLLETYGKRSRQLLSDPELVEFLHYLESQPS